MHLLYRYYRSHNCCLLIYSGSVLYELIASRCIQAEARPASRATQALAWSNYEAVVEAVPIAGRGSPPLGSCSPESWLAAHVSEEQKRQSQADDREPRDDNYRFA